MTTSPNSMRPTLTPAQRLTKAKITIYPKCPFTAYVLLQMTMTESPRAAALDQTGAPSATTGSCVQTMGVDARGHLWYNPAWLASLTDAQLMGALRHESLHVISLDFERTGHRNHELANICQDLVRNAQCLHDGFELPGCGLIPEHDSFTFTFPPGHTPKTHTVSKIATRCWEDIYAEVYPVWPKVWRGGGEGEGGGGGDTRTTTRKHPTGGTSGNDRPPTGFDQHDHSQNGQTEEERRENAEWWRHTMAEAAQIAKSMGRLPAHLEAMVDELLTPQLPWKQLLQKLIQAHAPSDFSWRRPSRRGVSQGLYLPSTTNEQVKVLFACDTSGSIGGDERAEMASEIYGALSSFPRVEAEILMCDAEVHNVEVLTSDTADRIKVMPFTGGGGTSHAPVLEFVEQERPTTRLLICFTDGHSDINSLTPPPYPVIWVLSKNGAEPKDIKWGEVIKLD